MGDDRLRAPELVVEPSILRAGIDAVGADAVHAEADYEKERERRDETNPQHHPGCTPIVIAAV